jgi:hypothetical protein
MVVPLFCRGYATADGQAEQAGGLNRGCAVNIAISIIYLLSFNVGTSMISAQLDDAPGRQVAFGRMGQPGPGGAGFSIHATRWVRNNGSRLNNA